MPQISALQHVPACSNITSKNELDFGENPTIVHGFRQETVLLCVKQLNRNGKGVHHILHRWFGKWYLEAESGIRISIPDSIH